ncbi:MAG: hypothetical protein ACQESE_05175 [Nanobdellota archaeon]
MSHSPTLDSVLMVEKIIRESDNDLGKYQLWKSLPRKMMYQTFQTIIDYLHNSGKIMIDNSNKIIWIYNPELIKRVKESGVKSQ